MGRVAGVSPMRYGETRVEPGSGRAAARTRAEPAQETCLRFKVEWFGGGFREEIGLARGPSRSLRNGSDGPFFG